MIFVHIAQLLFFLKIKLEKANQYLVVIAFLGLMH